MIEISIAVDSARALAAIERSPQTLRAALSLSLDRAAEEVAREMRQAAPKAFSTLTNSIRAIKVGELDRLIAPGVDYARFVEEGARPHWPGIRNGLREWVAFRTGARGPDLERRTFLIARAISRRGIKAQPFVAPTAERTRSRVVALLEQGVADGIRQVLA